MSVAIPFPGIDPVDFYLALHLFEAGSLVDLVGGSVPVMIGREVPLIQGALRTGDLIDLFTSFGHKPTRKYAAAHAGRASCTFRHLAVLVAQDLAAGNSRDDHHRRLAIEGHFFYELF